MNDWLEAEKRVEHAQDLSESQRWSEALAELDVAISINPNTAVWHAQRGFILEELDRCAEATDAYERSLDLEPGDHEVALALGTGLARQSRFARAAEVLEELSKNHADFEPAYCQRIHCYAELGLHDQAEQMFYLAQELDPRCPHCFYHVGVSLADRGQMERAIFCWNRALELEPGYIGVNRRIAQANRARGRQEIARDYYLRELRDDPGNIDLLFDLAELAVESGEFSIAVAKFEQIVELEPRNLDARFALGKILLHRGQSKKALTCFEAVEVLGGGQPNIPEFDWRLGEALFANQRAGEARSHLLLAAQQDPDNQDILSLLGDVLFALSCAAQAAECCRRVLAIDADNPFSHHKLARCLSTMDQHEAAADHCQKAIELKPDFCEALLDGARAHIQLGRWRDAREMLRTVLCDDPQNADARRLSSGMWRRKVGRILRRFRPNVR